MITIDKIASSSLPALNRSLLVGKTYVGVDFGTSTTVVSYAAIDANNHLHCETLPLTTKFPDGREEENDLIPSIVAFVDGKLCFGPAAAEFKHDLKNGVNLWRSFKMQLGEDQGKIYYNSILNADSKWPLQCPKDATRYFFKYLKSRIDKAVVKYNLPRQIEYAISIPASFEANQRQDLLDALLENGIELDQLSLIDEPNSAFLSYIYESIADHCAIEIPDNKVSNVLVFDYGAGTCDISILGVRRTGDGIVSDNIAISQFSKCGGDDVDRFIAEKYLYPQLRKDNDFKGRQLRTKEEREIVERLLFQAETLKIKICENVSLRMNNGILPTISFSEDEVTCFTSTDIDVRGVGKVKLENPKMSYAQFNELMKIFLCQETHSLRLRKDDYNSIFLNINSALNKGHLDKSEIDYVLLIGGSSKNPYIQFALKTFFEDSELLIPRNLQSHVSQGAAIHSFMYHCLGQSLIHPITSEDILVVTKGNVEKTIIPAGSFIPVEKTIVDGFEVANDGQKTIEIPICTGSKDKMLLNFVISCPDQIQGYRKGDKVRIEMMITSDKLLQGKAWVNNRQFPISPINPFANKEMTTKEREIFKLQKQINNERAKNGKASLNSLKALLKLYENYKMHLENAELSEEINIEYPNSVSLNNIALAYSNAGQKERAQALYQEALQKSPNDATIMFNYALQIKYSDSEKYQQLMERSISVGPNDPVHIFEYGRWLSSNGDSDRGQELIQRALKLWDDMFANGRMNSWDYSWMASAKRYVGDYSAAQQVENSAPKFVDQYYNNDNLINSK